MASVSAPASRENSPARPRPEIGHEQQEAQEADDDRRHARQRLGREAQHPEQYALPGVLDRVDRRGDPDQEHRYHREDQDVDGIEELRGDAGREVPARQEFPGDVPQAPHERVAALFTTLGFVKLYDSENPLFSRIEFRNWAGHIYNFWKISNLLDQLGTKESNVYSKIFSKMMQKLYVSGCDFKSGVPLWIPKPYLMWQLILWPMTISINIFKN